MINIATSWNSGAIMITGSDDTSTAAYTTFTNNRIISNFCNINHGTDLYGVGCNIRYIGNTIVRIGDRSDYRTINFPGGLATGHEFFDTVFEGGASFDSYVFSGSGTRSFAVGWSLHIDTGANAVVTIRNAATNAIVFTGTANASGDLDIKVDANNQPILWQYLQTPSGRTNYSYNIQSVYSGITHTLNGVIVDELNEVRTL